MRRFPRRDALRLGGIGLGLAIAGCLEANSADDDPGTDDDDDDGDNDRTTDPDVDVVGLGADISVPDWYHVDDQPVGTVVVIDSEERFRAAVPSLDDSEEEREDVEDFLDATDFETAVALYVASAGPSTCYGELEVGEVAVDDGTVVGSVAAVDGCDDGEGGGAAETFPAALVRITTGDDPPTEAELEITNGWEETETVTASADDPIGPDPDSLDGVVRPDGDPPAVPAALSCEDDDFERHDQLFDEDDLEWGLATDDAGEPTYAMRVAEATYERGDEVRITMLNVSDRERGVGNRHKYNLQVQTEDGWQDVRGTTSVPGAEYTDEAIAHSPGDGFEWTFELTEEGVVEDNYNDLEVCPGLPAGRYRFVHWSHAVGVAFDLVE